MAAVIAQTARGTREKCYALRHSMPAVTESPHGDREVGGVRLMKKWSYPSVVSRSSKLLGVLLAAAVVIGFGLSSASTASAATNGGGPTRGAWRHQMEHLAVPAKGCFTGSYPTIKWQQVQCHAAPKIPFAPREVPRIVSRHDVRPVAVAALKPAAGPSARMSATAPTTRRRSPPARSRLRRVRSRTSRPAPPRRAPVAPTTSRSSSTPSSSQIHRPAQGP